MAAHKISDAVIRRLPGYYRYLRELEKIGITRISSQELGARMGLTASQIRQDINCFGTLGQQGYGYNVSELRGHIAGILGLGRKYEMVIVGAGNIGQAVAWYPGFSQRGFDPVAMFDVKPDLIGRVIRGVPVYNITELRPFLQEHPAEIGVVATPARVAQQVAQQMIEGGVRAIWNFAPLDLKVPDSVVVNNVHLTDSLLVLTYRLHQMELQEEAADANNP
jgi:redox-sensing transcriptional repressor